MPKLDRVNCLQSLELGTCLSPVTRKGAWIANLSDAYHDA